MLFHRPEFNRRIKILFTISENHNLRREIPTGNLPDLLTFRKFRETHRVEQSSDELNSKLFLNYSVKNDRQESAIKMVKVQGQLLT